MKSFKQFHEEREQLNEAVNAAEFFVDFHRKNKNRGVDKNLWKTSRILGVDYRKLKDRIYKAYMKNMLPKDLEPEIKKTLRIK